MTTVRTIKLKRNPQISQEPSSTALPTEASTPGAPQPEAAQAAAPLVASGPQVSAKSYMPYVICASVVVLFFLIIMGLQYSEMSLYQADPSVWVKK
jgi:hypothetical protein